MNRCFAKFARTCVKQSLACSTRVVQLKNEPIFRPPQRNRHLICELKSRLLANATGDVTLAVALKDLGARQIVTDGAMAYHFDGTTLFLSFLPAKAMKNRAGDAFATGFRRLASHKSDAEALRWYGESASVVEQVGPQPDFERLRADKTSGKV